MHVPNQKRYRSTRAVCSTQGDRPPLLRSAGAHYVIEDLRALPTTLEEINQRLAGGERPR